MAEHSAYVSGKDLKAGSVISLAAEAVRSGDSLAIEYANGIRSPGKVISASANELEVDVSSKTWRLRPHAPSDGTVHNNLAGPDASFWTVQTEV
jgi:hypothetical protein